jgi:Translation initiation factor 3 (IF-3)
MAHPELGKEVLQKFADALSEYSTIETPAKLEGRQMSIILAPIKKEGKK